MIDEKHHRAKFICNRAGGCREEVLPPWWVEESDVVCSAHLRQSGWVEPNVQPTPSQWGRENWKTEVKVLNEAKSLKKNKIEKKKIM